MKLENLIF
jgi:hypothetical protein